MNRALRQSSTPVDSGVPRPLQREQDDFPLKKRNAIRCNRIPAGPFDPDNRFGKARASAISTYDNTARGFDAMESDSSSWCSLIKKLKQVKANVNFFLDAAR